MQMGRKMPLKKKDFIANEWHELLGNDKHFVIQKIVDYITNVSDKDDQCLSLCKYLIGHAIKTECTDDYIFDYIYKILDISDKTTREVVGWLIYSEDLKRYNIPLVCKFIEYDLIYLEEYDQALCKYFKDDDQTILNFAIDLLTTLILQRKKLCTVYDFIHTIEMLNKMNDNPNVVDSQVLLPVKILVKILQDLS
jgi:CCR4-NOT transcription complex subunit 1